MAHVLLKTAPLVSVLLVACGGGSNATVNNTGPTVDINSNNQQAVATEVSANALQFTGNILNSSALTVDYPLAVAIEDSPVGSINVRKLVTTLHQQLHLQALPVQSQAAAITLTETEDCAFGGTVSGSLDDTNNSTEWEAGESATVTFTDCVMSADGLKLNGSMRDDLISETFTTSVNKLTFTRLKVSKGNVATELSSGSMTLTESVTGSMMAGSFQSSSRYQTQDLSVRTSIAAKSENFTVNEDISLAQSSPNLSIQTISGNGMIKTNNANINGQVTFDITTPIIISTVEPVQATAGQMTISGSGGTALYISFATPTSQTATLQVKKDGQNVGVAKEVSISTLLAGLVAAG